jgi:hypothetical protein
MLRHNYKLSKIENTSVTTLLFLVRPMFNANIALFFVFRLSQNIQPAPSPPPPATAQRGRWLSGYTLCTMDMLSAYCQLPGLHRNHYIMRDEPAK